MILFIDGCGHYATAQLAQKWSTLDTTDATWTIAAEGRTANCIKRVSTADSTAPGFITFTPLFTQTGTWTQTVSGTFGAAFKVDSLATVESGLQSGTFSNAGALFSVYNGMWQMSSLSLNPNGTISLYNLGNLLATSLRAVNDAEWAYLEFQWLISTDTVTADGAFVIRSNGNQIMNYSGVLYPSRLGFPTPSREWNAITWLGVRSVSGPPWLTMRACDHYLADRVASADPTNPNDDFLGSVTIDYIKPDGAGANTDWTPSAGANWECVDEVPPDSDTTYVVSTAVGDRDTYTFEDITGDPKAIQVCTYVRLESSAAASIAEITRQSATDFDGPDHGLASTSYDYELQPQDVNPDTSLQWTESEVNAGEWGTLKSA